METVTLGLTIQLSIRISQAYYAAVALRYPLHALAVTLKEFLQQCILVVVQIVVLHSGLILGVKRTFRFNFGTPFLFEAMEQSTES